MAGVCESLDEYTLEFFEKFELLQKKRTELCSLMRDGYLNLSQARYSMGNKSVGSLQYSDKMEALVSVHVEEKNKFELDKIIPGKTTKTLGKANDDKDVYSLEGLRKRKIHGSDGKEAKDSTEEIQELGSRIEELRITVQDPIKWFGVLVPSSLRSGQKHFAKAVELCCEITNLEKDVANVIELFRELKMKKNEKNVGKCEEENVETE